jgi:hypothetical protein
MLLPRPILWLGLAGLTAPQRALLTAYMPRDPGSLPAWRVAEFTEADALCINGSAARLLGSGILQVPDSRQGRPPLSLDLRELDRPLMLTEPLADPELAPWDHVDPESERGVQLALKKLESGLQELRTQFALGALIHHHIESLQSHIYTVAHLGAPLAVVDFPGRYVYYKPGVSTLQLEQAAWILQPHHGPATVPKGMVEASMTLIMWQFAQHVAVDLLPERFLHGPIRLRYKPLVPDAWLKASQRALVRMLESGDLSLDDMLAQNKGFNREQLLRDLASFYFDGAIGSAQGDVRWAPAVGVASQPGVLRAG